MEKNELVKIFRQIDSNELISFDIFDTLIYRNVLNPTDVFDRISAKCKIKNFKKIRILAEKIANRIFHEKTKLRDIYRIISLFYGKNISEKILEFEVQEELKCCYFNDDFLEILKYCNDKKKRVILTSDMYLPKKVIVKIIRKIPFDFADEDINISCEYGETKRNGLLFRRISEKYNIGLERIVHIGDNEISDFNIPRSLGVNSFLYTRRNDSFEICNYKKINDIEYNQLMSFISKYEPSTFDSYEKIGYEVLGPLLAGFCYYLKSTVDNNEIFFLSRDGLIIKKCYDLLFEDSNTRYLYGSRKALINPTLHFCNDVDEMLKACYIPYKLTGKKLLKIFNVTDLDACNEIVSKYNDENDFFDSELLYMPGKYRDMMQELFPLIKAKSKSIESESNSYLNSEIETNSFYLVDIGWNGNMQKALSRFCNQRFGKSNIKGIYVGVNPFTLDKSINYFGYVNNEKDYKSIKSFISLFEFIFSNHDGSVVGYKNCKPIFDMPEYKTDDFEYEILDRIQTSAVRFVKDLTTKKENYNFYLNKNACFENINFLGTQPTLKQVDMFENVRFKDGTLKKFISNENKKSFKMFIKNYKNSLWRVGFLKKVFKININYFYINQMIRKLFIQSKNDY